MNMWCDLGAQEVEAGITNRRKSYCKGVDLAGMCLLSLREMRKYEKNMMQVPAGDFQGEGAEQGVDSCMFSVFRAVFAQ